MCFIFIQGLFRRAILMSGSALSDWAMANHPTAATIRVARELNCPLRNDNEEMLRCLRTKHYEEILKTRESTPQFSTTYGPLVDNSIIPDRPAILMNDNPDVFRRYKIHSLSISIFFLSLDSLNNSYPIFPKNLSLFFGYHVHSSNEILKFIIPLSIMILTLIYPTHFYQLFGFPMVLYLSLWFH